MSLSFKRKAKCNKHEMWKTSKILQLFRKRKTRESVTLVKFQLFVVTLPILFAFTHCLDYEKYFLSSTSLAQFFLFFFRISTHRLEVTSYGSCSKLFLIVEIIFFNKKKIVMNVVNFFAAILIWCLTYGEKKWRCYEWN